ncbi:carbohydrate-binding protein, partial [Streptomyces sparsus]
SGGRGGGSRGSGPRKRNGLLIGALAVVAAVVIGVGAAVAFSGDEKANASQEPTAPASSAGQDEQENEGPQENDGGGEPEEKSELPSEDASSLRLDNGPEVAKDIPGSKAKDGSYVAGFQPGAGSVTWTAEVPEAGKYKLYVSYSVPGKDAKMGLWVNDGQKPQNLNFKNFAKAKQGDWEKGWTYTYGEVTAHEGTNVFRVSCGQDDSCDVAVDRVWLAEMDG